MTWHSCAILCKKIRLFQFFSAISGLFHSHYLLGQSALFRDVFRADASRLPEKHLLHFWVGVVLQDEKSAAGRKLYL